MSGTKAPSGQEGHRKIIKEYVIVLSLLFVLSFPVVQKFIYTRMDAEKMEASTKEDIRRLNDRLDKIDRKIDRNFFEVINLLRK